jgi:glycosyltransferase involved in cell wall biosynthesis
MRLIYDFKYFSDCGDFIKLLILVNDLRYFLSHRLPIAQDAVAAGYEVTVGYGELGGVAPNLLAEIGFPSYFVQMQRGGTNPLQELRSLYLIWQLLHKLRPDVVHLVTIKPYLYGGIVARIMRVPGVLSAVAGLGSVFIRADWRSRLFRALLYPIYRLAFGHSNQRVIVQNQDDSSVLVNWGVLDPRKIRLLRGSGVDLNAFKQLEEPDGIPTICFAARLLRDKGVIEFVEAARLLRERGIQARFCLAGDIDNKNPTGLTEPELRALQDERVVEVLGYQKDIPALYAHCHVICLPSYREGLPKALVEAAAASRAVVTTDVPGCRDAIVPNESGLLVPVKSSEKLADALQWLIEHPVEREAMGKAGRMLAEREFAIEKIVRGHLDIYDELLRKAAQ